MPLSFLTALALAAVPPVSVGPDDVSEAPLAPLALRRVVVYAGRAQVEREGTVQLSAGPRVLRLPLLPGGVDPSSLRIEAFGARVLRVSSRSVERTKDSLSEAETKLEALEAGRLAQQRAQAEVATLAAHVERLASLAPSAPPSPEARRGVVLPTPEARWRGALDTLASAETRARLELRAAERTKWDIDEAQARLLAEVAALEGAGFVASGLQPGVLLEVEKAGEVRLRLVYEVSGPTWTPRYRLTHRPSAGVVDLALSAEVRQSTGEDWEGAQLVFSTAAPSRDLAIPQLQTWVLGEREDLVLTPRAVSPRPPMPRVAWPEPAETRSTRARIARLERFERGLEALELPRPDLARQRRARSSPPREPAPGRAYDDSFAEEMAAPAPAMSFGDVEVQGTMASGSGASSTSRAQPTALALFENAAPPRVLPPGLPREMEGADIRYAAGGQIPVPSGPVVVQVPLTVERIPVKPFHRAAPSLDGAAFARAEVRNPSDRPWLSGPVRLYVGDEPIGEARIATTGPGGVVALPLGRDERVEVARRVVSTTEKTGFLGSKRLERFEVTLELVSHLDVDTTVEVFEPVPVETTGKLDVTLEEVSPKPIPDSSMKDGLPTSGVLRWQVELAAKAKLEIRLSYSIEHEADERVYQR